MKLKKEDTAVKKHRKRRVKNLKSVEKTMLCKGRESERRETVDPLKRKKNFKLVYETIGMASDLIPRIENLKICFSHSQCMNLILLFRKKLGYC